MSEVHSPDGRYLGEVDDDNPATPESHVVLDGVTSLIEDYMNLKTDRERQEYLLQWRMVLNTEVSQQTKSEIVTFLRKVKNNQIDN